MIFLHILCIAIAALSGSFATDHHLIEKAFGESSDLLNERLFEIVELSPKRDEFYDAYSLIEDGFSEDENVENRTNCVRCKVGD